MRRNKKMEARANNIKANGTYMKTSGNSIWKHDFYRMPMGNIVEISYKDGIIAEVNNLGR